MGHVFMPREGRGTLGVYPNGKGEEGGPVEDE